MTHVLRFYSVWRARSVRLELSAALTGPFVRLQARLLAHAMLRIATMLDALKWEWRELWGAPAGERFAQFYERQQARRTPIWNSLRYFAAVFTLVIGLTSIPEIVPTLLLLGVSAALFVAESRWVAETFDAIERYLTRYRCACRAPAPAREAGYGDSFEPNLRAPRVRGERYNSHLVAMHAARALLREQMANADTTRVPTSELPMVAGEDVEGLERAARSYVAAHAAESTLARERPRAHEPPRERAPSPERAARPGRGAAVRRVRSAPGATIKLWSWELRAGDAQPVRHAGLVKIPAAGGKATSEGAQQFAPTEPMRTIIICAPPVPAAETER